jgi:hypothetical protein
MIELRPVCENCATPLPPSSEEAMICTFVCTFCKDCVENTLHNVCPNCGGGFEKRPVRPSNHLKMYPAELEPLHKPVDLKAFQSLLEKHRNIPPNER